jgi:DNA-binding NarL/FixJ family response regulator
MADEPVESLTDRELEILKLVAQGFSNPEIAGRLFLAEGTVKNYVTNILQKTGAKDRTEAAVKGKSLGWV